MERVFIESLHGVLRVSLFGLDSLQWLGDLFVALSLFEEDFLDLKLGLGGWLWQSDCFIAALAHGNRVSGGKAIHTCLTVLAFRMGLDALGNHHFWLAWRFWQSAVPSLAGWLLLSLKVQCTYFHFIPEFNHFGGFTAQVSVSVLFFFENLHFSVSGSTGT